MRIEQFLEQTARCYPQKVAIVCDGQQWTYKRLEDAADALASAFIAHGVLNNERVAIFLDNSVETVFSIFATLKVGGIFVVLGSNTKLPRLVRLLTDCEATALITDFAGLKLVGNYLEQLPHLKLVFGKKSDCQSLSHQSKHYFSLLDILQQYEATKVCPQRTLADTDPAALVYTSGSTGEPKGVILSHANIYASTTAIATYLSNSNQDIILSVLSLSHTYGLTQLMTAFEAGATLILERSIWSSREVVNLMALERVTGFALTPTIASALLELDLSRYDLSALRYVTNAAAALPVSTIHRFRHALPHVQLFSMYGLTECMRASFLPPDLIDIRPRSIGRGLPNQEMYIVDEEGARLGCGKVGELVVRGPNVMQGYWRRPEETNKVLKVGACSGAKVLYTGDLFEIDEGGYFYFVGRKDDMIKSCGEKVSPLEIEEVLCSLEGIAEAAVVGVPDRVLGQAIKAVIRLKEGAKVSQRTILRHCVKHLEAFKVPTVVEFRAWLPKTASGKIERHQLAAENTPEA
jgi:long-chain acyl-CoA synthetase